MWAIIIRVLLCLIASTGSVYSNSLPRKHSCSTINKLMHLLLVDSCPNITYDYSKWLAMHKDTARSVTVVNSSPAPDVTPPPMRVILSYGHNGLGMSM
jgi:hypothetical protein